MDFSRQLKDIQVQANHLLNGPNAVFYQDLEDFNRFYTELRNQLLAAYGTNTEICNRVTAMPHIRVIKQHRIFSFENVLLGVAETLFFPLVIVTVLRRYNYQMSVKSKLRELSAGFSSLDFLLKINA